MKSEALSKPLDEVYLTKDEGVLKRVFRFGDGPQPEKGMEVTVNYEGRTSDGALFDASEWHGEPLKIIVGTGQVI